MDMLTPLPGTAAAVMKLRQAFILENLALRHQIGVLRRSAKQARLKPSDRGSWVLLSRISDGWEKSPVLVKPEATIRWLREGFRLLSTGGRMRSTSRVRRPSRCWPIAASTSSRWSTGTSRICARPWAKKSSCRRTRSPRRRAARWSARRRYASSCSIPTWRWTRTTWSARSGQLPSVARTGCPAGRGWGRIAWGFCKACFPPAALRYRSVRLPGRRAAADRHPSGQVCRAAHPAAVERALRSQPTGLGHRPDPLKAELRRLTGYDVPTWTRCTTQRG